MDAIVTWVQDNLDVVAILAVAAAAVKTYRVNEEKILAYVKSTKFRGDEWLVTKVIGPTIGVLAFVLQLVALFAPTIVGRKVDKQQDPK